MADELIDVSAEWAKRAYVDDAKYKAMYEASIKDPAKFWGEHGKRVDWIKPYSEARCGRRLHRRRPHPLVRRRRAQRVGQLPRPASGQARRQDRDHLGRRRSRQVQAHHLSRAARRSLPLANALKELGVKKGDRVTIYLPMIPEAALAMLACARIGAIHSVVFGGFSPEASPAASPTATASWSSPPTRACAAASRCR